MRNRNKFCKYHRDIGHDTNDCFDLQNIVEDLIRRGYLKEFLKKIAGEEGQQAQEAATGSGGMNIVNTIFGGFCCGRWELSLRCHYR